ncbi:MAG: Gfo/Idh/MocA family oxidoreductase [Kiritimatiellae bacterium]|nr:Gfo/Idh/MocA family oxidoreductase [Kiritimatiellia bacterium]
MDRRFRMGMVGGGRDAFIGPVHRIAAQMDGKAELVCGAFSSTKQKSKDSGKDFMLSPDRVYGTYREMFRKEARFPEDERIDFVVIVTPNNMHYPIAMAALDAGFHVVCDKPMTMTLDEAKNLQRKIKTSKRLFCLTHNYTGNSMIKEAKEIIEKGKLGNIRRVVVEYPQGWLATRLETAGNKQAAWRTDPKRAGTTCCMGDIGSHCSNMAEYVTGLHITEVSSDLTTFIKGRPLDDDGNVMLRFDNGARGLIWASQIALGEENGLAIRVYGDTGSLSWCQEHPNSLKVRWLNKHSEVRTKESNLLGKSASSNTRIGQPEGYTEAFANIYGAFYQALAKASQGKKVNEENFDYPNVQDGIRGMAFLAAVVRNARSKEKWTKLSK